MDTLNGAFVLPQTNTTRDTGAQPVLDQVHNVWVMAVGDVEVYGRTADECKANALQLGRPQGGRTFVTILDEVGRRL